MASIPAPNVQPPTERLSASVTGGRLPALDGLRGIAALTVLAFHAMAIFGASIAAAGKGYLAVDFFFMLSGYVMARTYEHRMARDLGALRFLWARYRRLWPVMAIGAAVGTPLLLVESKSVGAFVSTLLPNLLLLPVLTGTLLFPVNGSAWSILFELAANLAHAVALWRMRIKALLVVILAATALLVWSTVQYGSFDVGARPRNALGGVPRALLAYTIGIVLWRWWRDRPTLAVPPALAFLAMPVLATVVCLTREQSPVLDFGFVLILCPLIIAGGLRSMADHPILHWAGALSFPLYAVHMPILNGAKHLGFNQFVGMAGSVAVAAIVVYLLAPSRRWKLTSKVA